MSYGYDGAGGLSSLTDGSGTTSVVADGDGRMVSLTRPSGVVSSYAFDPAGRVAALAHTDGPTIIESFSYGYDAAGNRTSATSSAGTETYGLDGNNRLVSFTDTAGAVTAYGYDAAGNRASVTDPSGTVTYTVDAAGQFVSDSTGVTYSYDPAGNLTATSGGDTYAYDAYGRTVAATAGGVSQTYSYDGDGVRVTVDGVAQLWDRAGGLPLLVEAGGDVFTHGPTGIHTTNNDHTLVDAIGSVRATVNGTGTVTGTAAFDPFGQGTTTGVFGFAGEQHDPTGMVHLRARQYDPTLGRFTAFDPVTPGGPGTGGYNRYSYTANNPTTWTDPSGQVTLIERAHVQLVSLHARLVTSRLSGWLAANPAFVCLALALGGGAFYYFATDGDLASAGIGAIEGCEAGVNITEAADGFSPKPRSRNGSEPAAGPPGRRTSIPRNLDPDGQRALQRENEAAQILHDAGRPIEQNPRTDGPKNPDLMLDGRPADVKSPTTDSARNVASTLEDAVNRGQADYFVVNLADSSVTPEQLRQQLVDYPIEGLRGVTTIDAAGHVEDIYP